MKKKWFEGSGVIDCNIQELIRSLEDQGKFYSSVVSFMPGITSVELLDQGPGYVTIKTNEGLMKRTNISWHIDAERVVVEFDEEYQAGRMITAKSHFLDEFMTSGTRVSHRTVISDVKAPGFLGFFYRMFGNKNIGMAVIKSYKTYLEKQSG